MDAVLTGRGSDPNPILRSGRRGSERHSWGSIEIEERVGISRPNEIAFAVTQPNIWRLETISGFVYQVQVGIAVHIAGVYDSVGSRRVGTSQFASAESLQVYLDDLPAVSFRHHCDRIGPVIVIEIDHQRRSQKRSRIGTGPRKESLGDGSRKQSRGEVGGTRHANRSNETLRCQEQPGRAPRVHRAFRLPRRVQWIAAR
jgi:hypothetical protein